MKTLDILAYFPCLYRIIKKKPEDSVLSKTLDFRALSKFLEF